MLTKKTIDDCVQLAEIIDSKSSDVETNEDEYKSSS